MNIRKLFIPSTIFGRRIIPERFLGIQIAQTFIKGAVSKHTGSKKIIEKLIEIDFEDKEILKFDGSADIESIAEGLRKVVKQAGKVDKIIISIPATMFIFKDTIMPFSQYEKIRMVINYEAEMILPFETNSCILDFIKSEPEKNGSCRVMVCATEKKILKELEMGIEKANLKPDNITTDIIALYDLCQQIENRQSKDPNYVILNISERWTKIGFVDQGFLRFVKNIPTGSMDIIEQLSQEACIDIDEAKQRIQADFGLKNSEQELEKHALKIFYDLCKKIKIVIQSFSSKSENPLGTDKIVVFEDKVAVPPLFQLCQQELNVTCQRLSVDRMLGNNNIVNRASYSASGIYWHLSSIACALTTSERELFDLGRHGISKSEKDVLKNQIAFSIIIISMIFGYIFVSDSIRRSNLSKLISEVDKSIKKKVVANLLPPEITLPRRISSARLVSEASKQLDQMKKSWLIHGYDDLKPLEILLDLTRLMDRNKFNVQINNISLFYDSQGKKNIELKGTFKINQSKKAFDQMISQIKNWKKLSDIQIPSAQSSNQINFSIKAFLEI